MGHSVRCTLAVAHRLGEGARQAHNRRGIELNQQPSQVARRTTTYSASRTCWLQRGMKPTSAQGAEKAYKSQPADMQDQHETEHDGYIPRRAGAYAHP